jgi:dTDP-4-amino-4,6-dideoxygalactose transaminase
MPAWTFVASAHAVVAAGLIPFFVDVDPHTWSLDPSLIAGQISCAPGPVGAVMPVAPFGMRIDVAAWDTFASQTGIPVVVDAAAGFDTVPPGAAPSVVSLHATKVLGTGEGGFVLSTDLSLVKRIRSASNFGFNSNRQAMMPATNAKMSEYHAAVGHAALDEWSEARAEWMAVAAAYRKAFEKSNHIRLQNGFGTNWVSSTCVFDAADGATARIERSLHAAGIETRRWWGHGAHVHPATARYPRMSLPVTEALAKTTIAVPHYRDLGADQVARIATIAVDC